ncbi:hypothetical protein KOR42_54290 [Thalassoglobus neptunius]|uniref:Uncharacterized protein n=1 Tax=Thalassoglobus neptunius TaxID=1938619 RepID=A0A5C5UYG3_9PLAN|nr:hypothetical protein KOR42_54290 [Thalassoglobus neptunius]
MVGPSRGQSTTIGVLFGHPLTVGGLRERVSRFQFASRAAANRQDFVSRKVDFVSPGNRDRVNEKVLGSGDNLIPLSRDGCEFMVFVDRPGRRSDVRCSSVEIYLVNWPQRLGDSSVDIVLEVRLETQPVTAGRYVRAAWCRQRINIFDQLSEGAGRDVQPVSGDNIPFVGFPSQVAELVEDLGSDDSSPWPILRIWNDGALGRLSIDLIRSRKIGVPIKRFNLGP